MVDDWNAMLDEYIRTYFPDLPPPFPLAFFVTKE